VYAPEYDRFLAAWRACQGATYPLGGGGPCYFYARLVDGSSTWSSNNITITANTGYQVEPAIAYVPSRDEFWVAWIERLAIMAQRVSTTGLLVGEPFTIVQGIAGMSDPSISSISTQAEFLVVWSDTRGGQYHASAPVGGVYNSIYAQRVLSNGIRVGNAFRVSNSTSDLQPKVAYLSEIDQYVVAWSRFENDYNIYAHWVSQSGQSLGGDFAVVIAPQDQTHSIVTGHNLAFVLWDDARGSPDIRGRFLQMPSWIYLPLVVQGG